MRGEPAGVFGVDADAFPPMVTLVWAEVWLVLFTVLPPAEWVDRVDWECVPVPAAPGWDAPGRWELPAPAAPGAGVLAAPEGGT